MAAPLTLSDYFVIRRGREPQLDLYVRTPEGGLNYIGSMMDPEHEMRIDKQILGTRREAGEPMVIVSDDGRAIAFYHQSDFAKGRSNQERGIYYYEYGKGSTQLHRLNYIPYTRWRSEQNVVPPNVLSFELLRVPGGWTSVPWAVTFTPEGIAEFPLALLGGTGLHKAAYEGDLDAITQLLNDGQDINARTYWGHTPLYVAIVSFEEQAAIRLIERGADLTAGEYSYLHLASMHAQSDLIEAILKRGIDVNAVDSFGNTPLRRAADAHRSLVFGQRGQISSQAALQRVTTLLKHGANPNAKDRQGNNALHDVAGTGGEPDIPTSAVQIARLLINAGVDADARNAQGNTPLHIFALGSIPGIAPSRFESQLARDGLWEQSETRAMLALLVSVTPDIDARNSIGLTPLQLALRSNQFLTAQFLVAQGADDTFRDAEGVSAREWMERALNSNIWKPVPRP